MTPWFKNVKPHKDIQDGHLDESVFAANLAEVASGSGREIYTNPEMFFQKTYYTAGLKNIAKRVVQGLNGGQDADNRVISLQTGFGGGKTHTLISLFHLAKWGKKALQSESTQKLIEATGNPNFETANIAVFTNTTNDPAQGRKEGNLHIRTPWGELAFQLGGKAAYDLIQANDEQLVSPKGVFKKVLEQCKPSLILIDELADYCVSAAGINVAQANLMDQTVSFLQELTTAVSEVDQCVLICTLPASKLEITASALGDEILTSLENRLIRYAATQKPVHDEEIYEVVRRRLFEDLGDESDIEKVVQNYIYTYQKLFSEVPSYALKSEYRDKLRKSYPFHPELIDVFRIKWASNPYFQRTRGVLRILGSIVSDLWKRQGTLAGDQLIHTSNVSFSNVEALSNQLTNLFGNGYDAVINADVSGTSSNAFRIDNEVKSLGTYNLTQGIAATILLGSFGTQGQNKGVALDELKLCMIKPDSFNHNDINGALDRLENNAHYLYYSTAGQKKYWFHTKPNINILINQAKNDIKKDTIDAEVIKRLNEKTNNVQFFKPIVAPSEEIPEQHKPTLVILGPQYQANPNHVNGSTKPIIEKLATKKGNSERIYRNTMLFLVCSEIAYSKLQSDVRDYLACQKIIQDYASQLEKEQKEDIKRRSDEASKQADSSLVAAYSIVAKYSVKHGVENIVIKQFKESLDTQINQNLFNTLKDEEWLLDSIGLNTLRNNNLLPTPEQPIKTKEIYEAFIRFDDKPMISGISAVQNSIQRYCLQGEYCIATGDGKNFSNFYLKETVPFFDVNDSTYWLVDKTMKPEPQPETSTATPGTGTMPMGAGTTGPTTAQEPAPGTTSPQPGSPEAAVKALKAITVSGKVPLDQYTWLFQYFIAPFTQSGNKVDIEVKFKMHSTETSPLDESKQQYKSAKEAAKQLGLFFEDE